MTADDYARFEKLRADLFDALAVILSRDGHSKSYEGTFRIQWPGYFDVRGPEDLDRDEPWGIFLDCYVIGPSRHYECWGFTFLDALAQAETDIRAWMHEAQEDEE
jgi:hypothetical protein